MKLGLSALLGLSFFFLGALNAQDVYKPIPPGFDFPADQNALLKIRDDKDVPAMRRHGWMVFAGLTQPARPTEADSEVVWETWYPGPVVFAPAGPTPQAVGKKRADKRSLYYTGQVLPKSSELPGS